MRFQDFLPFGEAPSKKATQVLPVDDQRTLMKVFKTAALAIGYQNSLLSSNLSRTNFESAPYDFSKILQATDTDSYVKQAFAKYKELFWKEGWEIVGENPEAVDYLYERIDYMEIAMNRPFQDFLQDAVDALIKFHNCFIVKSRGDLSPYFPSKLYPPEGKQPIMGYYLLPVETVEIKRDKYNRPRWYRQNIAGSATLSAYVADGRQTPQWNAKDVVHLYRDRKPGRIWGTPFLTAALDDVVALRQIEEDAQNLVHRELFPLYVYKIGTEDHPADPSEITQAVNELETLRTEGGLVVPERHEIDVLGAENKALDASPYLTHMKERVAIGLGMYPHHLGMLSVNSGGNRSMTDRLDTALYDKIKEYQRYVSEAIRLFVFNELLLEGGFDPLANPKRKGVSDRCTLAFREIDIDTQIKKETHIVGKVNANLQTMKEGRLALGYNDDLDEADTIEALKARMMPQQTTTTATGGTKTVDPTPPTAKKGMPNKRNTSKGASNVLRPTNQYGTRTSANIRHSEDWLHEVVELLDKDIEEF